MYIKALTFAGLFVLLIAGLNYVNLTLTRSTQRAKEVLLKKMLGISRRQLLMQSALESFILAVLVFAIATGLVLMFDQLYFDYTGFQSIKLSGNWLLLLSIFLITFFFGLLGTSYSGAYLSFSGSSIDKEGTSVRVFKKVLLGFQFAMASVMLIVTLTMNRQIQFIQNKDLGFSEEQVLIINIPDNEAFADRYIPLREHIKTITTIENASLIGSGALPGEENGKEIFQVTIDGNKVEKVYNIYRIDENYTELLDIKFSLGRNFHVNSLNDQNDAIIINESLARSLNWSNPLGKQIWYGDKPREVIGVVKNFHNKSLHTIIEPIVFMFNTNYATSLLVKTRSSDTKIIKSSWADFFPNSPFSIAYFDQFIEGMYVKEQQLVQLLSFFSVVSLLLCCIGLFAVFSLYVHQKEKEMSIRKVLGANAGMLLKSVTRSYIVVAVVAIGIAMPVAWYFMTAWLNGFNYKIQLNPMISILSACLVLLVSVFTIGYHVKKVLEVNPINSLNHE